MAKRPFDHDPLTGVTTTFEDTPEGFNLHYSQDCAPIVELNKIKCSMGREYYAKDQEMWRVASVPVVVQMEWLTKYGIDVYNPDHTKGITRLLNDPEWRYLKTAEVII